MNAAESPGTASSLDQVRSLLTQATQQLLGATIDVGDEQWRGASRCPGWSRGHLATHLARNAEALSRLSQWALTGERQEGYPYPGARDADIESGAGRSGMELQVDLDTTAGRLDTDLAALAEQHRWDAEIEHRGAPIPARLLPLMRLAEVALHHVDLDIGFGIADLESETAGWLLEFLALRLRGREEYPALELSSTSGFHAIVGAPGAAPRTVSGPAGPLLGWLTGRGSTDGLTGAEALVLPSFG